MRKHVARTFSALLLTIGAALTASACREAETEAASAAAPVAEHRVDVPALTVSAMDLESTLQISGNLIPHERVAIYTKLPGTVSRVAVNIGDRVRAGQAVAVMDRREIDAQVDAAAAAVNVARASVESAEAALANAVLEHERAQKLFDSGAIARQQLDAAATTRRSATAQRDLANANVAQADAALRRAREVQRDATLTSPIDGVVVERNYDAGSLASPGDKAVVVVADLRVLKLAAGVSELEAGRLQPGMQARISVQAKPGEVFDGRVAAIAPEVDPRNRHFTIEVRANNPGALLSGMYATASIPLEHVSGALAVPRDAVTTRAGHRVVLKVDGDTVHEVAVIEGVSDGTQIQIANGLKAGDVIVSDARRDVTAGAKVNPVFSR
jgi:RND family efflux transporter MFP subunit